MPPLPNSCDPCCGCIDLKIVSLVIGYLQLSGVIGFIVCLICRMVVVATQVTETNETAMLLISVYTVAMYIAIILLAFIAVLLAGIHLQKRGWVKAYMIVFVIYLVLAVIVFSLYTNMEFKPEVFYPGIIGFVLSAYFLTVILSYYREMGVYRSRY